MIQIFRTDNYQINKLTEIVPDSWIHLVAPTEEEIALVSEKLSLEPDFLRAALDEEERSRLEIEEGNVLILVAIVGLVMIWAPLFAAEMTYWPFRRTRTRADQASRRMRRSSRKPRDT